MKLYKALSEHYFQKSDTIDTKEVNYSVCIKELYNLSALQEILLEKVFKLNSNIPAKEALQVFNGELSKNWHMLQQVARAPEHPNPKGPNDLKLYQFPWETVYEIIRKDHFPERPKRYESYFAFNNIKDALYWQTQKDDYIVCEVNVIELRTSFSGDMYYLDSVEIDSTFNEISHSVQKYWNGNKSSSPMIETLLQGVFHLNKI